MNELLRIFADIAKESLTEGEIDFLTSGVEAKRKEYRCKQRVCRMITIILLVVCTVILLLRYY